MRHSLNYAVWAFLLLAALFDPAAPAAYAATIRIVPATMSAVKNDVISLAVQVDNAADLAGFQFDFSCPPAALQISRVTIAPAFENTIRSSFNPATGTGIIAAYSATPQTGSNLTLATIEFTVNGAGTLPVTLARQLLGTLSGDEIVSTTTGASITATSPLLPQSIGTISLSPGTLVVSGTVITSATATSGLGVIFASNTTSVCTVSGNAVTGVTVGTCSISADQPGNASYDPAPQITQNYIVGKGSATVALSGLNQVYDGTPKSVTATTTPAGKTVLITYDGSPPAPTNAGSYAIVGTISDDSYQGSIGGTLIIAKAPATVSLTGLSHTFDGTAKTAIATTAPAGKSVAITYNGLTSEPTASGSYAVVATINDSNYSGPAASGTLVISPEVPEITAFTIPTTASSLIVPVTSFSATDNVGVTGYILKESGTQPATGDPAWSATAPSQYTFASQGVKTLYAFAKDAAGNISVPVSRQVSITLPDITAPVVTEFTLPAASASLTVPVTKLTATDAVAVTAYILKESNTPPSAGDLAWSATAPTQYEFRSQGVITIYAFAKDAAGNISAPLSATTTITLADTTAPVVTGFIIPATASSLAVQITTLTASDAVGVTAYLLRESNVTPTADDPAWSITKPASYTFLTQGTKTLYVFAKDAAGNVSVSRSAEVTVTLADTIPPVVSSFTIPATSSNLTVAVSTFTATDAVGVTGYYISEKSTAPLQNAPDWSGTAVNSYTFASAGSKTLYAFAKDAAGNISTAVSRSVTITLPDTVPPTVTSFTLPATSANMTVPISSITAADNIDVTGYMITESATPPPANDSGWNQKWSSTAPESYSCKTWGNNIIYTYAKDSSGNVSPAATAVVFVGYNPATDGVIVPAAASAEPKLEPNLTDAMKSLNFAMKKETPSTAEIQHGKVAPLVNGIPKPDANRSELNLGDTIVILRRVVGL